MDEAPVEGASCDEFRTGAFLRPREGMVSVMMAPGGRW